MITRDELLKSDNECCGCGSCVDVCSYSVLSMKADKSGFLYPEVEHGERCINCKICVSVCPEKNYNTICSDFIGFYAGYLEDETELISCASGGLATALSKKFLRDGGVVYGCSYSDDWEKINYIKVHDEYELNRLKTSKYVQAIKGDIYSQVLNDLNSGDRVLFFGLPCDVLALRNRTPIDLQKDLFLVELVCHGPTSQEVHRQYLNQLELKYGSISFFSARKKKDGEWKPFYIFAKFVSGNEYYEQFHKSAYGAAFRYLKRPSCYTCQIKGKHLAGDLMIGDFHYIEEGMKGYNRHGVSSALVHNTKGGSMLIGIETVGFKLIEINKRGALSNGAITKAILPPKRQMEFRRAFEVDGLEKASRMAFVWISTARRVIKERIMSNAVKIKRLIIPSSKIHD